MEFDREVAVLRSMEGLRDRLERIEACLQELSYEDRMLLDMLCVHPENGNVTQLCAALGIEKSSVYRRRNKILSQIRRLFVENGVGSVRDDFWGAL